MSGSDESFYGDEGAEGAKTTIIARASPALRVAVRSDRRHGSFLLLLGSRGVRGAAAAVRPTRSALTRQSRVAAASS